MRPLIIDKHGAIRFKRNRIVDVLLAQASARGYTLNDLAIHGDDFPQDDWEQFYQLIGYSVSGYVELSFISDESKEKAELEADRLIKKMKGKKK